MKTFLMPRRLVTTYQDSTFVTDIPWFCGIMPTGHFRRTGGATVEASQGETWYQYGSPKISVFTFSTGLKSMNDNFFFN
jgi:hypothetical protein